MTSPSRPKWIFFDLDDTLWDFRRASAESLRHVFDSFQILRMTHQGSFDDFSKVYHSVNDSLWKQHSEGKISSSFLRPERWRRSVNESDHSESLLEECRKVDEAYLNFLCSRPHVVEQTLDMLDRITGNNLAAVISNGFIDTQYRKLMASGLWRYITRTIISDEIGIQKPSSLIFDYALMETGCLARPFTPDAPVFVGDNFATDIIGALRAGWRVIWFNPLLKPYPNKEEEISVGNSPLFLGMAGSMAEVESLLGRVIHL